MHGFEIQSDALEVARGRLLDEGLTGVTLHHKGWSNTNEVFPAVGSFEP